MLTLALFYYMCWGCPKGRSIVAEALIFVGNTLARMKRLCCFRASAYRTQQTLFDDFSDIWYAIGPHSPYWHENQQI